MPRQSLTGKSDKDFEFKVRRPEKSEFNAIEADRKGLEEELQRLEPSFSTGDKIQLFGSLILGVFIIPLLANGEGRFEIWMLVGGPFLAAIVCFPIGWLVKWQTKSAIGSKERIKYLHEQISNIRQFEAALSNWEYRRKISRITYWKELRGVDLEKGVKRLLEMNQWNVSMTQTVGDAGIDLVCEKDKLSVLVQCKGHKSPLGVSAIRDAAGVKLANKPDAMVVVAPNGFTKGSLDFARQADIRLVDAYDLNRVANAQAEFV